jgi:hypothetical protein
LGISTVTATGEVFNLNKIEDFSGNYAAGEAGIALAGGSSDVIMKNEKKWSRASLARHAAGRQIDLRGTRCLAQIEELNARTLGTKWK